MNQISVTAPDRATILTALRYFQTNQKRAMNEVGEIATNLGQFPQPTIGDIDALCARINGYQEEAE